jgi:hypothetical protein
MKRLMIEVFPTLWSPRKTILYLDEVDDPLSEVRFCAITYYYRVSNAPLPA